MDFFSKLKLSFQDKGLRNRLLFVLGALAITRLLAAIPVPGVDAAKLATFFAGSQFFGFLNIFSGSGLSNLSIIMLGVGPYITATVIMQVLTIVSEKIKVMYQEDGQAGRDKFNQISRLITVPIAFVQAFGLLLVLEKSGALASLSATGLIINVLVITGGSMLLMWIGELISEFGIGNGISLIIFAGIVSRLPTALAQLSLTFTAAQIPTYLLFVAFACIVIAGVVFISEAERPIPVTYAKRVTGSKVSGGVSTYLPLRINQAGVMPIIFGVSLLIFPQTLFKFLSQLSTSGALHSISLSLSNFLSNNTIHNILYFIFVFVFTYFYTAITFDPDQVAKNLQQSGAFVPGVRPGQSTADYLSKVLIRITLVGALFLGIIAVLPFILSAFTGAAELTIGGTALLIVVQVIIDFIKKIEAQITMREY
jgi:preprotein translocase subunit SecY